MRTTSVGRWTSRAVFVLIVGLGGMGFAGAAASAEEPEWQAPVSDVVELAPSAEAEYAPLREATWT